MKKRLAEVNKGDGTAVANALYGFVGIGNDSVIPELKNNLETRGNKDVALAYLNCGHPELEAAAQAWAERNGYQVYSLPGSAGSAQWGSL